MRKLSFDEIIGFRNHAKLSPDEVPLQRWKEMALAALDDLADCETELEHTKDQRDLLQDSVAYWSFEMDRIRTRMAVVKSQIGALRARLL